MSPELVTVLLAIQRRAKGTAGQVPLPIRYDPHEKLQGQPFLHLLPQHQEVLSPQVVRMRVEQISVPYGVRTEPSKRPGRRRRLPVPVPLPGLLLLPNRRVIHTCPSCAPTSSGSWPTEKESWPRPSWRPGPH
jgi:hypothetical protein